ncbi:zinc-dependent metalloprotease [Aquirufa sp. A-Brett2-15D]
MKKLLLLFVLFSLSTSAQTADKFKSMKAHTGYFNFYYDESNDKIYLEVKKLNEEFMYVYSLAQGVGNNDLGLDRGQLGNEQVVYFEKQGNKIFLVQPNTQYRANTSNPLEKLSVQQAFAKSVLFGFKIESSADGVYTIDITDFLMQDAHGVLKRLTQAKQGSYSLDKSKSSLALERTKSFPKNTEFEARLTFAGNGTGAEIRSVAPNADYVTVVEHHSFIELPDNKYTPRLFDPRSGANAISFQDYSSPVNEVVLKQWITRHRLEKKDPKAAVSEAVKPIIYYLDNGTPEPVRSALMEGGRWWNQAFEAIGYKDAFQVKLLPEGADPMDVRYHVIQWVHRSTRGWSYGSSITDPRTGEIMKGHVSLGSLRIRQDFLIAQALMNAPFAVDGSANGPMMEMSLARIRQLAAHEIGHTIGFAHNYAASARENTSVMDYPHPQIEFKGDQMDFSHAYDTKIGDWDKVSVDYAYGDHKSKEELNQVIDNAYAKGLRFITDSDARNPGGAHIYAHLWDNGKTIVDELDHILAVRQKAIANFSIKNIRPNETYSHLEDVFVPLYFLHRYQTEATTKIIGGYEYNYAVRGGKELVLENASVALQVQALKAITQTLDARTLAIPKDKLVLFPPRAFNSDRTRESFKGKTGITFDPFGAVESAADFTLDFLLHPDRLSRLAGNKAVNSKQLGVSETLSALLNATLYTAHTDLYLQATQETINFKVVSSLLNVLNAPSISPLAAADVASSVKGIRYMYSKKSGAFASYLVQTIDQFKANPADWKPMLTPVIPDGAPIGMDCYE